MASIAVSSCFLILLSILSSSCSLNFGAAAASLVSENGVPYEMLTIEEAIDEPDLSGGSRRGLKQVVKTTLATTGRVAVFNFGSGFSNFGTAFDFYGSAALVGRRIRLVSGPNQFAQAFPKEPVRFYNKARGLAGVFGTRFSYQFLGAKRSGCVTGATSSTCPGGGFTFSFQAEGLPTGGAGQLLGYGGTTPFSIAVEFDTVQNVAVSDPNNNHIGFNSRGSATSVVSTGTALGFDIVNNNLLATVWIEFWPQGGPLQFVLKVFITSGTTKPATPAFETVANPALILAAIDRDFLRVGFTAGTGLEASTIEIVDWRFFSAVLD